MTVDGIVVGVVSALTMPRRGCRVAVTEVINILSANDPAMTTLRVSFAVSS